MKVIVFGATGGLGHRVWRRAIDAGHSVVALVRTPSRLDSSDPRHALLQVVQGDAMDAKAVSVAAEGCEVLVNCTSPASGNSALEMAESIVAIAAKAGVLRYYMVGGLGALWVPGSNRSVLMQDWNDVEAMKSFGIDRPMPKEVIQNMTKGHLASMDFMAGTGLAHAFLCPGLMVEGPASPTRVVTLDELGGTSVVKVAYDDVAETVVEDIEVGRLIGHRVCVAAA